MSLRRTLPTLILLASVAVAAPQPSLGSEPAAAVAPRAAGAVRFRWPLDGTPVVVRRFDPPPRPWLPGHRGVDLAAAPGDRVLAAGAGVVHFAGTVAGRGVVSIDHVAGLRTTYEPVTPQVRAGDRLAAGEPLGLLAADHPGCTVAACLHWGLRRGTDYLDPLAMLGLGRVRLLPAPRPRGRRRQGQAPVSRAGSRSASRSYSSGWL